MSMIPIIANSFSGSAPPAISYAKNVRSAGFNTTGAKSYRAFGEILRTGPNRYTFYYRKADDHSNGGEGWACHYFELTDTFGSEFLIQTDTHNLCDCAAVRMGDRVFISQSSNDEVTFNMIETFIYELTLDGAPVGGRIQVTGTGPGQIAPKASNWIFGKAVLGDAPGEAYWPLIQIDPGGPVTLSCMKTTDYWVTRTFTTIYTDADNSPRISECAIFRIPGTSNMASLFRIDDGGPWRYANSTNMGATWTNLGPTNLAWQGSREKVTKPYMNGDSSLDIGVTERDTGWQMISENPDPSSWFSTGQFNFSKLYDHIPTGSHSALGYFMQAENDDGAKLRAWAVESDSNLTSTIMYTWDDGTPPVSAPPAPPSVAMTAQDALEVLIQITGYPTSVKQKIDQFRFQLSTQADFSTFASAIYRYTQGSPVLCDDEISQSMNFNFKSLTPGTTYYFRVRAENETGVSPYVSTSFTKS